MSNPKFDWHQAFNEWIMVVKPKGELTQKQFALSKGVTPEHLSTRFAEIKSERLTNKAKVKMGRILLKSLDIVDEGLNELDMDEDVNAAMKVKAGLDAFGATSTRMGIAPQSQGLVVNTNISLGVAMFAKGDEGKLREMFEESIVEIDEVPNE